MSVITIQFGQCGNQIGHNFFTVLAKDLNIVKHKVAQNQISCYSEEGKSRWFRKEPELGNSIARAILVDTEQKVIREINQKQADADSLWKYDESNVISDKGVVLGTIGAYGHARKGPELQETIAECVRKELERCDRLFTVLSFLSTAGGTGSGVGSYMVEALKDEYPTKTFVNAIVLPYSLGEIVTQNYNTVLTLSKIHDVSDMLVIFQNDHLHKLSINLLKNKNTDFCDLNSLISLKIASVFQPLESSEHHSVYDIISHLTPHPQYKFVTIKTAPHYPKETSKFEASVEWKSLVSHMKQNLRVSYLENEPVFDWEVKSPHLSKDAQHSLMQYTPCVSNFLVSRGRLSSEVRNSFALPLDHASLYPQWVPKGSRCLHLHQNRMFLSVDKFISLATNNSLIHHPLNEIIEKAWKMYVHKAHLHQYSKFDVQEEDFLESFAKMESVVKSYRKLK